MLVHLVRDRQPITRMLDASHLQPREYRLMHGRLEPSAAVPVFNEVEILPELFVRRFMVLNNTNVQSSKRLFAVGISTTGRGFSSTLLSMSAFRSRYCYPWRYPQRHRKSSVEEVGTASRPLAQIKLGSVNE